METHQYCEWQQSCKLVLATSLTALHTVGVAALGVAGLLGQEAASGIPQDTVLASSAAKTVHSSTYV